MPLKLIINGQPREFDDLAPGSTIHVLLEMLGLKADRIALELNGEITPRSSWTDQQLAQYDKLEVVHFVGGGSNRASGQFSSAVEP